MFRPLTVLLLGASASCLGATAQALPLLISQSFTPPPNSGAPPSTTAGASRGGAACHYQAEKTVVTPLMPKLANQKDLALGEAKIGPQKLTGKNGALFSLTLQTHPSFFWHVKPHRAGQSANFLLIEHDQMGAAQRIVYEAEVMLPDQAGIVRLDLPDSAPALGRDRQYEWFFSFNCDTDSLDSQVHLSGWLQSVNPPESLAAGLAQASPTEQARLLAQAGIWQDALMAQIRLRAAAPEDAQVRQNWLSFLASVGLSNLADEPMQSVEVKEILAY